MTTPIKVDDQISLALIADEHAEQVFDLVNANRIQFGEWLPWVDNAQSVDFIKNFIANSKRLCAEESDYAFVIIYNDVVVGRIGIYKIDPANSSGAIGYWLDTGKQGNGIVTKACKAFIGYCFNELQVNRIEIKCGTENYKSQFIPEYLNFKKEGIIRRGEFLFNKNKFIDLYLYSLLKEEWEQQTK